MLLFKIVLYFRQGLHIFRPYVQASQSLRMDFPDCTRSLYRYPGANSNTPTSATTCVFNTGLLLRHRLKPYITVLKSHHATGRILTDIQFNKTILEMNNTNE